MLLFVMLCFCDMFLSETKKKRIENYKCLKTFSFTLNKALMFLFFQTNYNFSFRTQIEQLFLRVS
jgi:hypothetical protein